MWWSSDKLGLVLMFFTCMSCSTGVLWVQSPSVVLLFGGYWRSPVHVWRVVEGQPSASSLLGTFSSTTEFWAKFLGCGNRSLALACPSHCATGTHGCNVAQPLGKMHLCRTGSLLCRCSVPLWAWVAWSFGAAGTAAPLLARKTVEMAFYCFICLPGILSQSAFCRRWGNWYKGEVSHFEEWPRDYFCFAAVLDGAALDCRAAICFGQMLTINIPLSAELGPSTTDTELPEAADLHYQ